MRKWSGAEPKEIDIQRQCIDWLRVNGFMAWRNQSAGVFDATKRVYRAPSKYQMSGASDCIAVKDGKVFFIEFKRPKSGKLSDSQIKFRDELISHGGIYVVIRSVDELMEFLGVENEHI